MRPDLTDDEWLNAAWRAVEQFPLDTASIELVSQSENVAFRVTVHRSDGSFLLRIHRRGYSTLEELVSERHWVNALVETGIDVQRSVRTREGEHYAQIVIDEEGEPCYVSVTTWIEGVPLRERLASCTDAPVRRRLFHRFGEIAAAFHTQSTNWILPKGFHRRRLDLEGLLGEAPFWGRFWEHPDLTADERDLLLRARRSLQVAVAEYGTHSENFSLIHADFTPDNIIVNGEALAVIDFDDSAFGWHMYDVASALVECRFETDYEEIRKAVLDGYRQRRVLAQIDERMIADFELIRGLSIIGWYLQRPEYAGAAYFERFREWVVSECRRRAY